MIYTLKIYDTELMTFELTQKPLEGFCCQIVSVKEENKHLLPIGMTVDGWMAVCIMTFFKRLLWIRRRAMWRFTMNTTP